MKSLIEYLLIQIRKASEYDHNVQVRPSCILWTDEDGQWKPLLPDLMALMPELFILGPYSLKERTGPAIWLRCAIAGTIPDIQISSALTPVLYLPGVKRQDLRAIDQCDNNLKAIAELQFRGRFWSQENSKDWTLSAFLQSERGGLGLDVAQDRETRAAIRLAVEPLFESSITSLTDRHLDKTFFHNLVSGGDPVKELLKWLNDDESFKASCSESQWKAFIALDKSNFQINPEKDGVLAGLEKLANREGPWLNVWNRFCDAPNKFPLIPERLKNLSPPDFEWYSTAEISGGWPQWNEEQEGHLKSELGKIHQLPLSEAIDELRKMEKENAARRELIWKELGESPFAVAVQHLSIMAEAIGETTATGNLDDLVQQYRDTGWKADDAVIRVLEVSSNSDFLQVVTSIIQALYRPWADQIARSLQALVLHQGYPGIRTDIGSREYQKGDCILFVDGLRFDLAKRLSDRIAENGFSITEHATWAALPSVTSTGKAAVSPVANLIAGEDENNDFQPIVADGKQSLSGYHLKKLLTESGWSVLSRNETGDGKGMAWCEFGNIDHEGHDKGSSLARYIDSYLEDIDNRIISLFSSGWKKIYVVTDHGWLLMPGGLPKVELPKILTNNKWGRCAAVKEGAITDQDSFPWYWNIHQHFTLATGIGCYIANQEYIHGGLSLQECLTLQLEIHSQEKSGNRQKFEITDVGWRKQRCKVALDGDFSKLKVDIRRNAGDASSSLVMNIKPIKDTGVASVVIEDAELSGETVFIVILDDQDNLITQIQTEVGKEDT